MSLKKSNCRHPDHERDLFFQERSFYQLQSQVKDFASVPYCISEGNRQKINIKLIAGISISVKVFVDMAKTISVRQPSGEALVLEVTPETTGRALKQQIKEGQVWDELTRSTTSVEIIVGGDHLLADDAKVLDAGIAEDTAVSVVFKTNTVTVICSNKDAIASLGVDSELLLVVEIPDDDTQIDDKAFEGCLTLAKVTIPDSVTHIGRRAFARCRSLVTITIPNSVTHIADFAFARCSSLVVFTIPNSLTHIGNDAFRGCSSLANLTIPNSVTHIGEGAFANCSSLASLTIPNSVTRIWDGAFFGLHLFGDLDHPKLSDPNWGAVPCRNAVLWLI